MTKKLVLMRHGKSDWSTGDRDFERPLNQRGNSDVVKMARRLSQLDIIPDVMMCSSSVRTTSTSKLILDSLELTSVDLLRCSELYLASLRDILDIAQDYITQDFECAMLVGHNPGLDDAVSYLSEIPPGRTLTGKLMTTAAAAVFDVTTGIKPNQCQLIHLLRPKEI